MIKYRLSFMKQDAVFYDVTPAASTFCPTADKARCIVFAKINAMFSVLTPQSCWLCAISLCLFPSSISSPKAPTIICFNQSRPKGPEVALMSITRTPEREGEGEKEDIACTQVEFRIAAYRHCYGATQHEMNQIVRNSSLRALILVNHFVRPLRCLPLIRPRRGTSHWAVFAARDAEARVTTFPNRACAPSSRIEASFHHLLTSRRRSRPQLVLVYSHFAFSPTSGLKRALCGAWPLRHSRMEKYVSVSRAAAAAAPLSASDKVWKASNFVIGVFFVCAASVQVRGKLCVAGDKAGKSFSGKAFLKILFLVFFEIEHIIRIIRQPIPFL